jgi:hypothetical protein
VKAPPADEPVKPAAPRPAADDAMRALVEEVARLRAQLTDLRTAQAATPRAEESQPPAAEEPAAPDPQPARRIAMGEDDAAAPAPTVVERETIVEREVPVYVDRDVPVYVDRDVIVEPAPTVVIEHVVCGDESCDQWVPVGHVHSAGCGHHYYGCGCHPSYSSLSSGVSLSFTYIDDDHDDHDHHDSHHDDGHHDDRSGGGSHGHAPPQRGSSAGQGQVVTTVPHRADADVPRRPAGERTDVAQPRRHQGDADGPRAGRPRNETASVATPPATEAVRPRAPERPREPDSRRERSPDPTPAAAPAAPPPPPPKEPRKQHKG